MRYYFYTIKSKKDGTELNSYIMLGGGLKEFREYKTQLIDALTRNGLWDNTVELFAITNNWYNPDELAKEKTQNHIIIKNEKRYNDVFNGMFPEVEKFFKTIDNIIE